MRSISKRFIFFSRDRLAIAFCVASVAFGILRAIRLAWVCDDAFISFRYSYNFARGRGLVFNAGEYVEGFTNLLWTLLLTPFLAINVDIVAVSQWLGILCYAVMLLEFFRIGKRLLGVAESTAQDSTDSWRCVPWSLPALAVHHHLHIFATSGLETPLFTLLVTSGVLRIALAGMTNRPAKFGFLLLAVACLTRPDGILIYGVAAILHAFGPARNAFNAGQNARRSWFIKQALAHVWFVILVGGSFVFRVLYYGDILPNTFYAKSAHDPYFGQGFFYAALYFGAYWILIPALLILVVAFVRGILADARPPTVIAAICFAWIAYVLWVGGDFMFGRFLVPITPLLYLGGELALRSVLARANVNTHTRAVWWFATIAIFAATVLRYDPYRGRALPVIGYVGEEHKIYTTIGMRLLRETALATKPAMQAADPVVAFVGAQAALIFYWDITTAIEAQTGLTDRVLAKRALTERGWIGHEKTAPLEYLRERGVDFILRPPPSERRASGENVMKIQGLIGEFEIINYRRDVMGVLRRDARFVIPDR